MAQGLDRTDKLAVTTILVIFVILPVAAIGYALGLRPILDAPRTIDIVAAAPENGGFQPASFEARAGETVHLRITSPDVVHGIAIGPGEGWDFGFVMPGEVKEIDITFPRAGRYTLYCNVWCSPTHWRMRAAIDVSGTPVPVTPDPIIERLTVQGVDIDAPHPAETVPTQKPSVVRGKTLLAQNQASLPADVLSAEWRQSHSPAQARAQLNQFDDADAWDIVAALWLGDMSPEQFEKMIPLYGKNCAACHGSTGNGVGVGAEILAAQNLMGDGPVAFTAAETMLGASNDVLYGKIQRGGMGTGMPGFGPVFTRQQSANMVNYLWSFVFDISTDD